MINITNLNKKFDDKILFNDFNFEIQDGEFCVFCGESGCGKTTLLNMIGCLEKPDSGSIIIDEILKEVGLSDKKILRYTNFPAVNNKG